MRLYAAESLNAVKVKVNIISTRNYKYTTFIA